jgi:hypothetical protein
VIRPLRITALPIPSVSVLGRSVFVARDPPSEPSPGHRADAVRLLRRRRKVDRREMNDIH